MSGHRSSRRTNQWVLPLALTATAAVATAALWWWTEHSDKSPSERLTYDSDYDPTEEASTPPGSTSKSRSKSKRKEAMDTHTSGGKKKEKLPDVREETESEREKKLRSSGKEKEGKISQFKKKQEVDPSGYASGYASEGGRSRSVNGGGLSRASLVSQDEIKRYVMPVRKRSVVLVLQERDLGRGVSDEQVFQVQKSSLLSFLRPPLINESSTTLFFLLHQPNQLTHTPIEAQARSLMPPTYPSEFFIPYEVQPEGLINMLRAMEPQIVYVEEALAGAKGELVEALLDKSWVGYVVVVLAGRGGEVAGLVDTEDEDTAREDGGGRWWEVKGGVLDKYRGRCSVVERVHLADDWQKRIVEKG
ncbi:hypothetical protein BJ508DRAFT_162027 [Ascobolus immersus RN42]|uniref:Uncharacterized protein n=1 Tax=Ascobolus immersus RN42 TaxID=1160509 RepID=A0A3N4HW92_ASCIM|nr:hypothetical protein BJ508DRAFT_162027 [Ascobolus immersus RN42]